MIYHNLNMNVKIVTESNITNILEKNNIIFLDFWASWCEPCKVFAPIFERVSELYPDIFFGKINTEIELLLSSDFEIRSIPTLVILKQKEIIYSESGIIPEYVLKNLANKAKLLDVSKLVKEQD